LFNYIYIKEAGLVQGIHTEYIYRYSVCENHASSNRSWIDENNAFLNQKLDLIAVSRQGLSSSKLRSQTLPANCRPSLYNFISLTLNLCFFLNPSFTDYVIFFINRVSSEFVIFCQSHFHLIYDSLINLSSIESTISRQSRFHWLWFFSSVSLSLKLWFFT